ncbi:MAG: hypothetical protein BMS9Abin26_1430 [Gammaproteobacteria bacterium]|nr:MAG: hypothetical protein BMS9Abin26_1430 [Gammaproteobacteria bacterium]
MSKKLPEDRSLPAMITRGDMIVIVFALLLLLGLYSQLWRTGEASTKARILSQDGEYAVVSLYEDRIIKVPGPAGITVVEVRDGAIRCAASPGPNRICQRAGWMRYGGEVAVSLPNRVVIQILADNPRYDGISF